MVRVVAVSGSRREASTTRLALEHALAAAEDAGAETELLHLGDVDLPLYHPSIDEQGDSEELTRLVREADGVVLGSPVYHGSYSSTFRNFHDYCSFDEYRDTVVGLLATAGGGSYGATLEHMRSTVRGVHGWVVPHQVGIRGASREFDDDGAFVDPNLADRVEKLGRVVAEEAEMRAAATARANADD
ncbi:NADPH-dependent FMN reductase [Halomarina oriensis]|uniref:NADPH-dependent oxidoreductase n=1 Tax=Halomarina oriensis TaxID=671145 RepID=A0A6B0GKL0_9EURY|nr:NADPH-dependent FMN reductase [Halomarina oriensis]MWG34421.1 NADPH-dependent oxidoreductase [Halomarina oriensis]